MRRRFVPAVGLGLWLWMLATPALAAHAPEFAQAKAAFRAAQKHYDLGEFQKALNSYSDAYQLNPLPAFLFNMAQCHRQLGNYERAAFYYARFLEAAPSDSANTRLARDLLKDMRAKQRAQAQPSDAPAVTPEVAPATPPLNEWPGGTAPGRALPPGAMPTTAVASPARSNSVFKKWWFWTAVGGVVVVTVVAVAAAPRPRPSTLADINAR